MSTKAPPYNCDLSYIRPTNEKMFINGEMIEPVANYRYLGVLFSSHLNWHLAQTILANQANQASKYNCEKALNTINTLTEGCVVFAIYVSCV